MTTTMKPNATLWRALLLMAIFSLLTACNGGSGPDLTAAGATITSTGLDTYGGGPVLKFSSGDSATTWSLSNGAPGTLGATTGSSVTYTPPAEVSADQQVTLTATSANGSTTSVTFTLHAPSLGVVATPQTWTVGGTPITLTVSPKYTSQTPTWSVSDGGTLGATSGDAVTYTPATVTGTTQVAASATVGSHTESVSITVNPLASTSLTLNGSSVQAGTSNTITATAPSGASGTLTWSLSPAGVGTLAVNSNGSATYTPPSTLASTTTVTITATNGTGTWTATLTLTASPVVSVTPAFGSTSATGPNVSLTATVANDVVSNVKWALTGKGSLSATTGATISYVPDPTDTTANDTATVTASDGSSSQSVAITLNFQSTALFDLPRFASVDGSGNLYVADSGNNAIRKITAAGVVTTFAGRAGFQGSTDGTGSAARFNSPQGIAVDSSGNLYVADLGNDTIRMITAAGVVTTIAGTAGTAGSTDGTGSAARFNGPEGITVDSGGNLYIADGNNNTIRKITAVGVVTTIAGTAGSSGFADGSGSAAQFNQPAGIARDKSGNLYVADTGNDTIRKIDSNNNVTTLAGIVGTPGAADGTGTVAQFYNPIGVALDNNGNLYAADTYNGTIREITPAGAVTTLAGMAGFPGSTDGTGSAARFNFPAGIVLDSNGNAYVVDTDNDTIRMITSGTVVSTVAGQVGTRGSADGTALQRQ